MTGSYPSHLSFGITRQWRPTFVGQCGRSMLGTVSVPVYPSIWPPFVTPSHVHMDTLLLRPQGSVRVPPIFGGYLVFPFSTELELKVIFMSGTFVSECVCFYCCCCRSTLFVCLPSPWRLPGLSTFEVDD